MVSDFLSWANVTKQPSKTIATVCCLRIGQCIVGSIEIWGQRR